MGVGLNGFIFKEIIKNWNIKEKKNPVGNIIQNLHNQSMRLPSRLILKVGLKQESYKMLIFFFFRIISPLDSNVPERRSVYYIGKNSQNKGTI